MSADYFSFTPEDPSSPFLKPTLILTGRQDAHVGYREALALSEYYPRATVAVLDRAGHALGVEQARLFQALVHEWLDRVEETSQPVGTSWETSGRDSESSRG